MEPLHRLVSGLSKEEIRFYKLFAARTNERSDRKDLLLFNRLRKSTEGEKHVQVFKDLYDEGNRNAAYRLTNRLHSEINRSLAALYFDEDSFSRICGHLALYHHFIESGKVKQAQWYLRKAEKEAEQVQQLEFLDLIYGEYIRLSHDHLHLNPELYISKRREVRQRIDQVRIIDDLLAAVSWRLKATQNFGGEGSHLLDLLKKTTDDFVAEKDLKLRPEWRLKVFRAVSQILLQRHDYSSLEKYLLVTYKEFVRDSIFNKASHEDKLRMLTYIVNALFKNEKYKKSLQWAEILHQSLTEYGRSHYDRYIFYYYNALVINYSVLEREKAISILEDLRMHKLFKENSYYQLFIHLNLAVLHFDKGAYRDSVRYFSKLLMLDGFKTSDTALRLRIEVSDLIARFEAGLYDVVDYKLKRLKRDYSESLQQESFYAEARLLYFLKEFLKGGSLEKEGKLARQIEDALDWMSKNIEKDTILIDYSNWIKSSLKKWMRSGYLNG